MIESQEVWRVVNELSECAETLGEMEFWCANPEIKSLMVRVHWEFDDEGEFFVSRSLGGISFLDDDRRREFLRRHNYAEGITDLDSDEMLEELDEELGFTANVAQCKTDTTYYRPEDVSAERVQGLEKSALSIMLRAARGARLYVVTEPAIEYDDSLYYPTEGSYVNGAYVDAERAEREVHSSNREIIRRYSADEVDEDDKWFGDKNPDECDEDEALSIWMEHKSEFLAEMTEVTLE